MKITFDRELLISKLKLAAAFIPKKAVIPAYTLVLFEAEGNIVRLTAQNGEMQIINKCSALKSSGNGKFTVPGNVLLKTISLMKEPEVTISFKNDKCNIVSGKSKYVLSATDGEDHIRMPRVKAEYDASFVGSVVNTSLEVSLKYASKDSPNVAFQGVCLREADGNKIGFFSSNMHSVSKIIAAPRSITKWADIIIPEEVCKAIVKCVNDIDIVDIVHNKKNIEITSGEIVIIASVLDVSFPNVDNFFAKKPDRTVTVNTLEFLQALQRLALVANEDTPEVTIGIGAGGINMNSVDENFGNKGDEEVGGVSEHETEMKFSLPLLTNIVDSFSNDSFVMSFGENRTAPAFFDPVDNVHGNNKFFLIAPLK